MYPSFYCSALENLFPTLLPVCVFSIPFQYSTIWIACVSSGIHRWVPSLIFQHCCSAFSFAVTTRRSIALYSCCWATVSSLCTFLQSLPILWGIWSWLRASSRCLWYFATTLGSRHSSLCAFAGVNCCSTALNKLCPGISIQIPWWSLPIPSSNAIYPLLIWSISMDITKIPLMGTCPCWWVSGSLCRCSLVMASTNPSFFRCPWVIDPCTSSLISARTIIKSPLLCASPISCDMSSQKLSHGHLSGLCTCQISLLLLVGCQWAKCLAQLIGCVYAYMGALFPSELCPASSSLSCLVFSCCCHSMCCFVKYQAIASPGWYSCLCSLVQLYVSIHFAHSHQNLVAFCGYWSFGTLDQFVFVSVMLHTSIWFSVVNCCSSSILKVPVSIGSILPTFCRNIHIAFLFLLFCPPASFCVCLFFVVLELWCGHMCGVFWPSQGVCGSVFWYGVLIAFFVHHTPTPFRELSKAGSR